jgi:hypothetical protein
VWCRPLDEILGHSGTSLAICSRAGESRRPPPHFRRLLRRRAKSSNVMERKIVSGPPLLYQAALDALKKWKYKPTYLHDQPIAVQVMVTITLGLEQ